VLRARLATAAVVIPLLLVLILVAPAWGFALFVGAVALVGLLEYMSMAFPDRPRERLTGVTLGAVMAGAAIGGPGPAVQAAVAATLIVGLSATVVRPGELHASLTRFGLIVIGVLYTGFLLPHFVWLREGVTHGPEVVVFILATAMAGDTGGYFVGRAWGRHKLNPRVSPGKSIEGAAGIVAGGVLGAALAKSALIPGLAAVAGAAWELPLSWPETLVLGLIAGVLGQFGDLGESVIKRSFGVKESGWIFPGHGGALDRIDSLLFPAALVYYYLVMAR